MFLCHVFSRSPKTSVFKIKLAFGRAISVLDGSPAAHERHPLLSTKSTGRIASISVKNILRLLVGAAVYLEHELNIYNAEPDN